MNIKTPFALLSAFALAGSLLPTLGFATSTGFKVDAFRDKDGIVQSALAGPHNVERALGARCTVSLEPAQNDHSASAVFYIFDTSGEKMVYGGVALDYSSRQFLAEPTGAPVTSSSKVNVLTNDADYFPGGFHGCGEYPDGRTRMPQQWVNKLLISGSRIGYVRSYTCESNSGVYGAQVERLTCAFAE